MKIISIIGLFSILFVGSMSAETPLELEVLQAYRTADFEKLQKMIDSGVDLAGLRDWSAISFEIRTIDDSLTDRQKEKYIKFFNLNTEKARAINPGREYYGKAADLLSEGKGKELKELLKACPVRASELIDKRNGGNLLDMAVSSHAENDTLVALIEAGISPNAPGSFGMTSLALAATQPEPGRSRILKCLIEHGGDMSFKPEGGLSAEEVLKKIISQEEKAKPAK